MRRMFLVLLFATACAPKAQVPAGLTGGGVALIEPQFHDCETGSASATCYDVPIRDNARVTRWVQHATTNGKAQTAQRLRISGRYLYDVRTELAVSGLPEDLSYVPMALTGFQTTGTGAWLISSKTAAGQAKGPTFWTDSRRDVALATRIAARHLQDLHTRYGDWNLAIAAYTSGTSAVDQAIRKSGSRDYWKLAGYLPRARRDDVPKVIAIALIAKHPEDYGFEDIAYEPRVRTDAITVRQATSLHDLADLAGADVAELERLNPALTRGCTPPEMIWDVQLPRGTSERVIDGLWDLSRTYTCGTHRVRRGETLGAIANKYGMNVQRLAAMNEIANPRALDVGVTLSVRKAVVIDKPSDRPFNKENLPQPIIDRS